MLALQCDRKNSALTEAWTSLCDSSLQYPADPVGLDKKIPQNLLSITGLGIY
jgi:hypothetical protein